ncbi:MAG: hypothetical protein IJ681_07175, partial [Bacteroidales bacterium]|nr:hypothetical protein [Bacteroidales bacterium]
MKKTIKHFLLPVALAVAGITQAYSQINKNIVDTTKVWNNFELYTGLIRTNSYKISSEQVELNGKLYNKVLQQFYQINEDFSYKGMLIREDSGRVYIFLEQQLNTELLLYDFNAEKDSHYKIPNIREGYIRHGLVSPYLYSDYYVVTSIDSIEINNQQLKRITLSPTETFGGLREIQWIEGIGSTMGFIDNFSLVDIGETFLRCCTQENELIYFNDHYYSGSGNDCFLYASIDNVNFEDINIFPNPAKDRLSVSIQRGESEIFFMDCLGRNTKRYELHYGTNNIDIRNLSGGIYTAIIISEEKII